MITRKIDNELWLELDNESLWKGISGLSIAYKGDGNTTNPKLYKPRSPARPHGFKRKDLTIRPNSTGVLIVHPNPTIGISFSTTIDRLERLNISGVVWKLPKNTLLPDGLVFNLKSSDKEHPLLNVSKQMPLREFITKLDALAKIMLKTNHKIPKRKR